eukprot:2910058-Alexandrium_andersonii.AAC.1
MTDSSTSTGGAAWGPSGPGRHNRVPVLDRERRIGPAAGPARRSVLLLVAGDHDSVGLAARPPSVQAALACAGPGDGPTGRPAYAGPAAARAPTGEGIRVEAAASPWL